MPLSALVRVMRLKGMEKDSIKENTHVCEAAVYSGNSPSSSTTYYITTRAFCSTSASSCCELPACLPSLFLLIDVLRLARLSRCRRPLALEVPVVEVASACAEVCCEAEPAKIRRERPAGHLIHLSPNISQVAGDAGQRDDVDRGFDRAVEPEEEWHPDQVQAELDSVQGCALL